MSTGQPIRVRAAMKPFSTVPQPLATVDLRTGEPGGRDQAADGRVRRPGRRRGGRGGRRPRAGATPSSRSSAATRSPETRRNLDAFVAGLP